MKEVQSLGASQAFVYVHHDDVGNYFLGDVVCGGGTHVPRSDNADFLPRHAVLLLFFHLSRLRCLWMRAIQPRPYEIPLLR